MILKEPDNIFFGCYRLVSWEIESEDHRKGTQVGVQPSSYRKLASFGKPPEIPHGVAMYSTPVKSEKKLRSVCVLSPMSTLIWPHYRRWGYANTLRYYLNTE